MIRVSQEFELLADSIKQINDKASSAAKNVVNQLMTLRSWKCSDDGNYDFRSGSYSVIHEGKAA